MKQEKNIHILLHNIRSAHNVGAIFRTADALGASIIYISGYTPSPLDRFGRPVKEIAKTALHAEKSIPWEHHVRPQKIIKKLRAEGYAIVGIEQEKNSLDYKKYQPTANTLLVLGNEVRGLSSALRTACDSIIEIPMRGTKESLNVSVAFGIVAFRLFDE